jgi:putative redox protein
MNEGDAKERIVTVGESGIGPYGQIVVAGRHLIGADEPEGLGGRDTGPDPFELVMAGLGACTSMTVRMYAERKGWPVQRVVVTVRQADPVDGRTRFVRQIAIQGEIDGDQRRRLVEIANKCPVHRALEAGAHIETESV